MSAGGNNWFYTRDDIRRAIRLAEELQADFGETVYWTELIGLDREQALQLLAGRSENILKVLRLGTFIALPESIRVEEGYAVVRYANKVKAIYKMPSERAERERAFKLLRKSYHVVELRQSARGARWYVTKFITLEADEDEAARIVEQLGWLRALGYIFGYREEVMKRYWWRALPLAGAHVVELTPKGTGKTEWAMTMRRTFGFAYYGAPPTRSDLIWDGRTRTPGAVYIAEGVIFDEFDKYESKDARTFKELKPVLLTAMEQGVWQHPVSGARPIVKKIPVVILGNSPKEVGRLSKGTAYGLAVEYLARKAKMSIEDLEKMFDRVAAIVYSTNEGELVLDKYRDLSDAMLKPKYARGVANLFKRVVRERVESAHTDNIPSEIRGRAVDRYLTLRAAVELLGLDFVDPEDAALNGYWA